MNATLLSYKNSYSARKELKERLAETGVFVDTEIVASTPETVVKTVQEGNFELLVLLTETEFFSSIPSLVRLTDVKTGFLCKKGNGIFLQTPKKEIEQSVKCLQEYLFPQAVPEREICWIRSVGASTEKIEAVLSVVRRMAKNSEFFYFTEFDDTTVYVSYDTSLTGFEKAEILRMIVDALEDTVYNVDGTTLEKMLVDLLKMRKMTISVAESFTGGGVGKRIVSVPGASQVYVEGLNTYSEDAKAYRLGVLEETLAKYGAVSEQTAYEMASGLLDSKGSDICIATTGLAGPDGDGKHPVGLCYIAVGVPEKIFVYKYQFTGTREEISEKAITYALFETVRLLKKL